MNRIRQLIETLHTLSAVGIIEQRQSWLVVIAKGSDLICEVTVPFDVLEWHACVKHGQELNEVWSDWMDYSGYDDRPEEVLEGEMADDILAFVDRVLIAEPLLPLQIHTQA